MEVRRWGRILGRVPFTDRSERDVYEDAEGRQYVHGDSGRKVFGQWLSPGDEPKDRGPAAYNEPVWHQHGELKWTRK
jgi:hypothetical protein